MAEADRLPIDEVMPELLEALDSFHRHDLASFKPTTTKAAPAGRLQSSRLEFDIIAGGESLQPFMKLGKVKCWIGKRLEF